MNADHSASESSGGSEEYGEESLCYLRQYALLSGC